MLPYDTGICCYAFIYFLKIFYCFCPFLFYAFFLKSGIDKTTEWCTIPASPSLMCFFNRGGTEGTYSSRVLCSMFVCVLFCVSLCAGLILWFLSNLWFDDLCAEWIGERLNSVFSRDVILCG